MSHKYCRFSVILGSIVTNPEVTFDDVIGLEQAKISLKEAVILPIKFRKLFRGTPLYETIKKSLQY